MEEEKIIEKLHELKIKILACDTSLRIIVFELAVIIGMLIRTSIGN